jgi:predicted glutamine amidotransferase
MFFKCSREPFNIDLNVLKKFISSCHWKYLRKYNLLGHHHLGWGFAYIPENDDNKLIIKRDITPIYHADWRNLTKIKTKFIVVHARKAYPWLKNFMDIHPININEKYIITHNGTITNFSVPRIKDPKLEIIFKKTNLDTRKYLCCIINNLKNGLDLKKSLEFILKNIEIGLGANAFLFNSNECNIIKYQNEKFTGRHRTLFINKENHSILVSTSPLKPKMKEIPNYSLIQINLSNLITNSFKLEV